MNTLKEIEAAAEALPKEQKEELRRFLTARLLASQGSERSCLVRSNGDVFLEAPQSAPAMTAELVKQLLEDWP